jgi:hypothetical protein
MEIEEKHEIWNLTNVLMHVKSTNYATYNSANYSYYMGLGVFCGWSMLSSTYTNWI